MRAVGSFSVTALRASGQREKSPARDLEKTYLRQILTPPLVPSAVLLVDGRRGVRAIATFEANYLVPESLGSRDAGLFGRGTLEKGVMVLKPFVQSVFWALVGPAIGIGMFLIFYSG